LSGLLSVISDVDSDVKLSVIQPMMTLTTTAFGPLSAFRFFIFWTHSDASNQPVFRQHISYHPSSLYIFLSPESTDNQSIRKFV